MDIEEADFAESGTHYMIGVPPVALDFLTAIGQLDFPSCWNRRVVDDIDGIPVGYLGRDDLVASKEQTDRPQDRADIRKLKRREELSPESSSHAGAGREAILPNLRFCGDAAWQDISTGS